ncbi:MAG: SDR family oxidoreductase [Pyrinomonadaceae bacterium]
MNGERILIFGGKGMLGHKLVQALNPYFDVWTTVRDEISVLAPLAIFDPLRAIGGVNATDLKSIKDTITMVNPDVVINAVGVIKQLPTASDTIATLEVNSIFPHRLAELSTSYGFRLICISTDCVFDGRSGNYTEDDVSNAEDLYGKSKNLGEISQDNCLTIRTSIIGREIGTSHSLVDWFLSNTGKSVRGYVNAIYSGFPTVVFADIIADLIGNWPDLHGLYHVSSNPINKFELLTLLNDRYNAGVEISPFEDFHINRSLDSTKFRIATGFEPESWDAMIRRMAADPTPYDKWKQ